jgi:hypothetical protein
MPAASFGGTLAIAHAALNPAPSAWVQDSLPVSAADLQQNLTDLDSRLTAVEGSLRFVANVDGGAFSVGTTLYCGSTPSTPGDLGALPYGQGYLAAKQACATKCGTTTAHMCSSEELTRSAQLAIYPPAEGWFASGVASAQSTLIADCYG